MSGIPAYPVISAQPEFDWFTPQRCFVRIGAAQNVTIPETRAISTEFVVVDNLGLASLANPITIYATLFGGAISTQMTTPGGLFRFTWAGAFFAMG